MSTLHKTTQPAYDKYGNKVEAKATVQAGRSEVAEFRHDLATAVREADSVALGAIKAIEWAASKIERIDNQMTGRGEFISIFEKTLKAIGAGGMRNGKIAWKGHLQRLNQELEKESAKYLKD